MNNLFVLFSMIFLHVIADYCLQGILASMKQKQWWKEQKNYSDKYKYDYIIALFMHSFSWTFMILLPIIIVDKFNIDILLILLFIKNIILHFIVDNLKANLHKINLVEDQLLHMAQILTTFTIWVCITPYRVV